MATTQPKRRKKGKPRKGKIRIKKRVSLKKKADSLRVDTIGRDTLRKAMIETRVPDNGPTIRIKIKRK
jgi:hypothetical protein